MEGVAFLDVVDHLVEVPSDWVYNSARAFVILSNGVICLPDFDFCPLEVVD